LGRPFLLSSTARGIKKRGIKKRGNDCVEIQFHALFTQRRQQ
jgi:hypothetical protein